MITFVKMLMLERVMAKTLKPCVLFQTGVSGKTFDQEEPAVKSHNISNMINTAATPIS